MQKSGALLIIVGLLVAIGIVLSFYGNQVVFQDLVKGEGDVSLVQDLTVESELDQELNDKGIYAVQILDFKNDVFSVSVYDPSGIEIDSQQIDNEVFEGGFDIISSGKYQIVIKSTDQDATKVFGVIGPEPDANAKSLGFISLYILVIGLIGMVGVGIYAVKNRRK